MQPNRDQQEAFMSNCFPVRNNMRMRHRNLEEGGAWMVVYRNKQKRQLKAVLCSQSKTYDDIRKQREIAEAHGIPIGQVKVIKESLSSTSARMQLGRTLCKMWLLRQLKIEYPEDTAIVRIESCDLSKVADEELEEFVNVIDVKAADNVLPIDAFIKFSSLETLEMQMNYIGSASSVASSFMANDGTSLVAGEIYPNLKLLNLDYNDLNAVDFDALSYLPSLEKLSVISNRLCSLPPPDYQRIEANLFFPSLTALDVSENGISADSDFLYLCGMPKLQHLIISSNGIKRIPSIHFTGHRFAIVPSRPSYTSSSKHPTAEGMTLEEELAEESARALSTIAETTSERSSPALLLLPPFPELIVVNMGNNLITTDLDLAGILSWPSLKQVILDGNPLAKRDEKIRKRLKKSKKGDNQKSPQETDQTASICSFLEQSLGINVVRSRSALRRQEETVKRASVSSAPAAIRKYPNLDAKVPKVPKCDVDKLLALCAPAVNEPPALPAGTEPSTYEASKTPPLSEDMSGTNAVPDSDANIQFFMTELTPDMNADQIREECEKAEKTEEAEKALVLCDPRFKGFEELFVEDEDQLDHDTEFLEIPATFQGSVHALRNMLELPSVSRRPVAAIEAWANRQFNNRRRISSSTLETLTAVGRPPDREPIRYEPYVSRNQALGPLQERTYGQVVDGIVSNQKSRDTVGEAPLGSVLRDGPSRYPRQYQNARHLLRQITSQYDTLRRNLDQITASSSQVLPNRNDRFGTS